MSERLKFDFFPYSRPFKSPLKTHHGLWEIREGIIVQLTNQSGKRGAGEIAPLSWFGSETLEEALNFCQQLPTEINQEFIQKIPDHFVACQFGFESALEKLTPPSPPLVRGGMRGQDHFKLEYSGLLPAGQSALTLWKELWKMGYKTFKWKIGVSSISEELELFKQLLHELPATAKLRLDANGGLSIQEAKIWLNQCQNLPQIELIEQPLPVEQFSETLDLSHQYSTPIALDESVANLKQLKNCYQAGWRGIFVIKPCIFGFPSQLRDFCHHHALDLVFSSVFETEVGREFALQLAAELQFADRAVGFGIQHWFHSD